ncbi:hypothetical protein HU200_058229 [Digitaria exilis]|uniref:Bifunctional inhibitor/plant lipid transfer protein/seed storage helical domain-containing protein n=1 Tax=Digitaria exilis TaxID=1010633 RepID=A0A835E274_9POAL|nr:hypothetical protein HU200_058229 [Digitaria exilis]
MCWNFELPDTALSTNCAHLNRQATVFIPHSPSPPQKSKTHHQLFRERNSEAPLRTMGPTAARLRILPLLLIAAASLLPSPASAADAPASSASASASAAAYASARDAAARCAATIVSISPCLPHVAAVAPPLAASSPPAPTGACCVAFLRAVYPSGGTSGGEGCLCHLLRNPLLLGFPVDAARLGALLPACAAGSSFAAAATVEAATLFADACRGERAPTTPQPRRALLPHTRFPQPGRLFGQAPRPLVSTAFP